MADQAGGSSHGGLYFVVGALVVALGVVGYFALGGGERQGIDAKIEAPKAPAPKQ